MASGSSSGSSNQQNPTVLGGLTDTLGKTVGGVTNTLGETVSGLGRTAGGATEGLGNTVKGAGKTTGDAVGSVGGQRQQQRQPEETNENPLGLSK